MTKGSRTYGVLLYDHPSGKYGVKYSEPKTHTVLERPYSGNTKPELTRYDVSGPLHEPTHEGYEPTYELVYEPAPRSNPKYAKPEIQPIILETISSMRGNTWPHGTRSVCVDYQLEKCPQE